ncbi:MAG: SH3 domain-containing protein [Luteibacter sp.]
MNEIRALGPTPKVAAIPNDLQKLMEHAKRVTAATSALPPAVLEAASFAETSRKAVESMMGQSIASHARELEQLQNASALKTDLLKDIESLMSAVPKYNLADMIPDLGINSILAWQKDLAASHDWTQYLKLSVGMTSTIADMVKAVSADLAISPAIDWPSLVDGSKVDAVHSAEPPYAAAPRTVVEVRSVIGEDELAKVRASLQEMHEAVLRVELASPKHDGKDSVWKTVAIQLLIVFLGALITGAVGLAFDSLKKRLDAPTDENLEDSSGIQASDMYAISSDNATVYRGPAATQGVVAVLAHGDLVRVFKKKGRWVRVAAITEDRTLVLGWVKASRIESLTGRLFEDDRHLGDVPSGDDLTTL